MMKFKWTFVVSGLVLLLSACGGTTTPTAKLILTANPPQVASGFNVTLTATIDEGAENVALVEFAVKDQPAFFTDDNAEGGYTAESATLTANTTFVAVAKDAAGTTLGSSETSVTVTAAPPQPNAEAKTVTTLAGVQVVGGGTPTGLAVTTEKLVAQNGSARLKGTATGGAAVVNADGTFTFTPDAGATSGSFDYEVFSGTLVDAAKVTINITALPADTRLVSSLAELTTALDDVAVKTIIIKGTIGCNIDNCIRFKAGQTLTGSATVAGVAVTNPGAKIDVTVAGDEPADPTQNNITAIVLAANTKVEGIEISGRDIYTAINGVAVDLREPTSPADAPVPSTVNVKNIKIVGPTSNRPFAIRFSGPPTEAFGSYYILKVDGLNVTGATNVIGISAFSELEFKNSSVAMNIDFVADPAKEFGISFHAYGNATAVVDKLKVTSSTGSANFSPVNFVQSSGGGVYNITLSNTNVNFAQGVDLTTANAFFVNHGNPQTPGGKIVINTANSKGNTTNSTAPDKAKFTVTGQTVLAPWMEGQLEVNGQNVP
jgi:Bacterial Ig domain